MSKYIQSKEAIDTSLLLWDIRPTQTSVQETYDIVVYPSAIYHDQYGGPINFVIPAQSSGCLINIDIVTEWRVMKGDDKIVAANQVTIVNNFSNALWNYVDVQVGDRVNVMQSMENAYAYQTFFNTIFNNQSNRKDYLFESESFVMDDADGKTAANCLEFTSADKSLILNKGSTTRAERIAESRILTSKTKLHTSLLTHSKVLPTEMRIKVTLVKNRNAFLLMAATTEYKVVIQKVFLQCTFVRPRDFVLNLQEERLKQDPALYDVEHPEISMRSISAGKTHVTINDLFPNKLPKVAFFAIQNSTDLVGDFKTTPFCFNRMRSFQLYVDNHEYFPFPIKFVENDVTKDDFSQAYMQLYKTLGLEMKGDCLVNAVNFNINYILGVILTPDKEHLKHLNIQKEAEVRAEITLEVEGTFTLITYAIYDRLYTIDHNRQLSIIE